MSDHFIRAIAGGGTVLGFAAVTTETVEEARRRHQAAPTAAAALGRTLAATVMLGAGLKDGQRLTVRVLGGGPLGGIVTEGNGRGEFSRTVRTAGAVLPCCGTLYRAARIALGRGTLHV